VRGDGEHVSEQERYQLESKRIVTGSDGKKGENKECTGREGAVTARRGKGQRVRGVGENESEVLQGWGEEDWW
jgi:hypothetical protein